jgi:hypothetical protein
MPRTAIAIGAKAAMVPLESMQTDPAASMVERLAAALASAAASASTLRARGLTVVVVATTVRF